MVVVVGSINVDFVTRVSRLPGAGETVIGSAFRREPGGKGANQATAAARLGARAVLVGCVGDDDFGAELLGKLASSGVDVTCVATVNATTGIAQVLVDASGENMIALAPGANSALTSDSVSRSLEGLDAGQPGVVLAGHEVPHDAVLAASRAAVERGWSFVLNPAPARSIPAEVAARCTTITPNRSEVAAIGGVANLLAAGAASVVVTLGADGAELHRPGLPVHRQAAFDVAVSDTTGAGDAFSAALAVGLASGDTLERAVKVATAAAALSVMSEGATGGLPDRDAVDALLAGGERARRA